MGGCGNQIFQYATGLALARRLGVNLQLDVSGYEAAIQNPPRQYSLGLFRGVDARVVHTLAGQVIREKGLAYQPDVFENAPRNCSIVGYWQCEKYFAALREELCERVVPREPLPARSAATEQTILAAAKRSVSVHVRRADFVGNPYHEVLPLDYYEAAAQLIAAKVPDPVFFIFSDDPEWCEVNFKLPFQTIVSTTLTNEMKNHRERDDVDMYLMRQCRHAIIANSSYSWWGAWMGADKKGGVVIAPKHWFGPAFKEDPKDIVPERWIRL
jgi:hypothetical protein